MSRRPPPAWTCRSEASPALVLGHLAEQQRGRVTDSPAAGYARLSEIWGGEWPLGIYDSRRKDGRPVSRRLVRVLAVGAALLAVRGMAGTAVGGAAASEVAVSGEPHTLAEDGSGHTLTLTITNTSPDAIS